MYQQPHEAQVPKNYSGNAFRYPPIGSLIVSEASHQEEVTSPHEEESPQKEQAQRASNVSILPELTESEEHGHRADFSLFGRWLENEELLLIGLVVLLLGERRGEDERSGMGTGLVLCLLLLLLYG